jgi:F-type H+-transporting ATPase subunit c
MKTKLFVLWITLLILAVPTFAQTPATNTGAGNPWVPVTAGFAMAIASGLCALGMGKAISGAAEGAARNPGAFPAIRFALIFGLALIESLALYTLVIVFVKVV